MKILKFLKGNKLLSVVILIYIVLFVVMPNKGQEAVKNSMYYVIEMLEIMPVVFILTSLLEAWVPRKVIYNSFGEDSGIKGSVLSFVIGSFSAGPIYAAFPVCKMLLKKGASIYNIIIILSAWAVIKVPMLINEVKFLGGEFMGIRWILTVTSIMLMAYIVNKIVKKNNIPIEVKDKFEEGSLKVNQNYCIGCGLCSKLIPEYFAVENKKAKCIKREVTEADKEKLEQIISKCPASAIKLDN